VRVHPATDRRMVEADAPFTFRARHPGPPTVRFGALFSQARPVPLQMGQLGFRLEVEPSQTRHHARQEGDSPNQTTRREVQHDLMMLQALPALHKT
jgi:hypothetical protein